jgi:hypothetical protein
MAHYLQRLRHLLVREPMSEHQTMNLRNCQANLGRDGGVAKLHPVLDALLRPQGVLDIRRDAFSSSSGRAASLQHVVADCWSAVARCGAAIWLFSCGLPCATIIGRY